MRTCCHVVECTTPHRTSLEVNTPMVPVHCRQLLVHHTQGQLIQSAVLLLSTALATQRTVLTNTRNSFLSDEVAFSREDTVFYIQTSRQLSCKGMPSQGEQCSGDEYNTSTSMLLI